MPELTLTFLGYHWEWSGDLFFMTHEDGRQARVFVDSIGETWVDIRRVPEGGWFPSERVDAYRVFAAADAERDLLRRGFGAKEIAPYAHRVKERDL
jgi:hypothetical protein